MTIKTQRLYYGYSGTEPFEAEILEIRPGPAGSNTVAALLDKTIFYPEGGGQAGDRGFINGLPLLDTVEEEGEILHILSIKGDDETPKPGRAELLLDYRRRRDFSAAHTGQHLLSGILFQRFHIPTVSAHLGEEVCFIDIQCPELPEDTIIKVEEAAMDIIEENRPMIVHLCPPEDPAGFPLRKPPPKGEEVIRILEIEGLDFSPCRGTHLKSAGEIGMLRILGAEKYKAMTRLSFITGRRVLYDSRRLRKNAETVSRALSVPVAETGKGVLDFIGKTASLESRLKVYREEACRTKAGALAQKASLGGSGENPLIIESYPAGMDEVVSIGRAAQKLTPAILLLVSETENKFAAFCGQKNVDLRLLFRDKLEASGGKGGGGPSFFQGSFPSEKELSAFTAAFRALV